MPTKAYTHPTRPLEHEAHGRKEKSHAHPISLRRCLRYHTLAAAYVALVLALGGTAYAAITVTGENIVDGSITSADIGPSEVKTTNLARDGVTTDNSAPAP